MIKITKPPKAPALLLSRGSGKCTTHCNEYLLHKADYDAGKRTFAFDPGIYGDATVEEALIKAQHGKCCFCERKTGKDGDVEHIRPKAGCRQKPNSRLLRPGYYWRLSGFTQVARPLFRLAYLRRKGASPEGGLCNSRPGLQPRVIGPIAELKREMSNRPPSKWMEADLQRAWGDQMS